MSDKITVRFCGMTYDEIKAMKATNQQLLSALELIASAESADQRAKEAMVNSMIEVAKNAIANAKQVMGDKG